MEKLRRLFIRAELTAVTVGVGTLLFVGIMVGIGVR